jgi:hypothetical protein
MLTESQLAAKRKWKAKNAERIRAYQRDYYSKNTEKVLATNRKWADANYDQVRANHKAYYESHKDAINTKCREWEAKNPEKANASKRNWRKRNPQYMRDWMRDRPKIVVDAYRIVKEAVKNGTLQKRPCFCGKTNVHAHHENYANPLDVIWVCPKHHKVLHKEIKESCKSPTQLTT